MDKANWTMYEIPGISDKEWRLIIKKKKDFNKISKDRIRRSIIQGIPGRYRGAIWCLLCDTESDANRHDSTIF